MSELFIYSTREGDTVPDIAYRFYGKTFGAIEIIFKENRELSYLPRVLPIGTKVKIRIEEKPKVDLKEELDLWE